MAKIIIRLQILGGFFWGEGGGGGVEEVRVKNYNYYQPD